jgi:hypothetical protein
MSVDLHVEFLNPRSLLESQGLERFLRELVAYGFDIKDISVGKGRAERPQAEESTTQLLEHARRDCRLGFHAAIPTMRGDYSFEFGVDLAWGAELLQGNDRIWIGMTSWNGPLVNYPEYDPAYHSKLLLDIGTWLYSTLAPDFGWIDFGQTGGYTWFDDIEQSRIPRLNVTRVA